LVLNLSEDAYLGDAQYTIAVDGQQVGGVRTETALHSSGQSEQVSLGLLSAGSHQIAITFLNDAYGGSSSTDRNLYVDSATYNGQTVAGSSAALLWARTQSFAVTGDGAPTPTSPVVPDASAALMSAGTQQFTAIAPASWTV
jgi:hypothetical protein